MAAIKDFFINLAHTYHLLGAGEGEAKDAINISQRVNSNGSVINYLVIKQTGYIKNVIIPLFDSLTWHTKK